MSRYAWDGKAWDGKASSGAEARADGSRDDPYQGGEPERRVHITWARILKWGAVLGGMFGAGYILRGFADSTAGTANLLEALRGKKAEGELAALGIGNLGGVNLGGMNLGPLGIGALQPSHVSRPPSPEELQYWGNYYRRGAQAVGELPPTVLPRVPVVEVEPLAPPGAQELRAERSLLAPAAPRRPRFGGGYGGFGGGGYGGGGYSSGYAGGGGFQEDYSTTSVGGAGDVGMGGVGVGEEFTIVKEG